MKLPELRIGNFFALHSWYEEQSKTGQITEISKKHVCINAKSVSPDHIIPIEITEGILLHSGFKHFDWLKDSSVFECKHFKCTLDGNGVNLFCDDLKIMRSVKYLHELQNLYFDLTEEELEIDLNYITTVTAEAINN